MTKTIEDLEAANAELTEAKDAWYADAMNGRTAVEVANAINAELRKELEEKYISAFRAERALSADLQRFRQIAERYNWVSVNERLPPDGVSVLVAKSNGHVDKTAWSWGAWVLPSSEPHVTHWMPLPPLPDSADAERLLSGSQP